MITQLRFLTKGRSGIRHATTSMFGRTATTETTTAISTKEPVPDVVVTFGNPPNHMSFMSHPGMSSYCGRVEKFHVLFYPHTRLALYSTLFDILEIVYQVLWR